MSLANKQFMVTITHIEDAKSNFVHLTQIICYPYPIWVGLDPKKIVQMKFSLYLYTYFTIY
jgi:hypothetical protein